MKRFVIGFGWLVAACVAVAGTGTSNEFRIDTRTGVRTVAATEKIQYSTAWATNLTAAQQGEAKAVVKVNPCLKTPPKYLVVDMSGGRSAARWPISCLDEVPAGGWTDEYKTEKLVLRYIPAGSFIMGGRATDSPGAAARGIPCFQKEKVAIHFLTATYVKDVLLHCCKAKWQTWRVGTKNHEARKQKTHAGLGENAIPDSQIFNLQTRGILIRRLDASAKEKDDSASSASGGGIWVTAGGRMTVLPGAVLKARGGYRCTGAGGPGGGGRIALAQMLSSAQLAAMMADEQYHGPGKANKHVFEEEVFKASHPGVGIDVLGGEDSAGEQKGSFRFVDGQSISLTLIVR